MPRAPASPEEISARRERILDAAAAELAARGYRGATIRAIAHRAELADGTLYNYFASKEALLDGLLERMRSREHRKLELGTRAPGQLRSLVEAWIQQRLEPAWPRPELLGALLPAVLAEGELRDRYRETVLAPMLDSLEAFLQRLRAGGRVRDLDPRVASRAVVAMILGLLLLRVLEDPGLPSRSEDLVEPLTSLLLQGLAAPAPGDE